MCKKKHISGWWFQPTILRNDGVKVNGKDDIPYMKWKIKVMFETTNQVYLHIPSGYGKLPIEIDDTKMMIKESHGRISWGTVFEGHEVTMS
jgi:hypothetical protein